MIAATNLDAIKGPGMFSKEFNAERGGKLKSSNGLARVENVIFYVDILKRDFESG
jgi:hypothetical protein